MPGMNDQIRKYQNAVGKKNVGSQPSHEQVTNAKNTAIGKMRGTITSRNKNSTAGSTGRMSATKATRGKARGSWEGFMHAPTAYLAHNDTGYGKKSLQHARNAPQLNRITHNPKMMAASHFNASRTVDFRNVGSGVRNSICKLTDIMKSAKTIF